jgi:hypothetical protein
MATQRKACTSPINPKNPPNTAPREEAPKEKKRRKKGEKKKKKNALPYRAQNSKRLISGGAEFTNRAGRAPPG